MDLGGGGWISATGCPRFASILWTTTWARCELYGCRLAAPAVPRLSTQNVANLGHLAHRKELGYVPSVPVLFSLDARVLLEYAARMPFHAWKTPSVAARQVNAVGRRIHALTQQCAMEKNRLHAASATATTLPAIVRDLRRSVRSLENAVVRLQREGQRIIASTPLLQRRFELLQSTPGIAAASALQLLGELALTPADCDVRQWVAYAGLDPRQYESGSSVQKKTRISKVGNRHLRRILYMPALTAVRFAPHLRAFYEHLQARGKCKMVALVAVMRKLLHAIFGMFKHDTLFDGAKLCPTLASAGMLEVARAA